MYRLEGNVIIIIYLYLYIMKQRQTLKRQNTRKKNNSFRKKKHLNVTRLSNNKKVGGAAVAEPVDVAAVAGPVDVAAENMPILDWIKTSLGDILQINWDDLVKAYIDAKVKKENPPSNFTVIRPETEFQFNEAKLKIFGELRKFIFLKEYHEWKNSLDKISEINDLYGKLFENEENCSKSESISTCVGSLNHFYDFGSDNPTSDWDVCCIGPYSYKFVERLMEKYLDRDKTAAHTFDNNWYLAPVLSMLMENGKPVVEDFKELTLYTLPWRFTPGKSDDGKESDDGKDFRDVVIIPDTDEKITLEKTQLKTKIDKKELPDIKTEYETLIERAEKIDKCVYQNVGFGGTEDKDIKDSDQLFEAILKAHETSQEAYYALSTMFVVVYFLQGKIKEIPARLTAKNFLISAYENLIDFEKHGTKLIDIESDIDKDLINLAVKYSKYLYRVMLSLKLMFIDTNQLSNKGLEYLVTPTNIGPLDKLYNIMKTVLDIRNGDYKDENDVKVKEMITSFCKKGGEGHTLLKNLRGLNVFCNPYLNSSVEFSTDEVIKSLIRGLFQSTKPKMRQRFFPSMPSMSLRGKKIAPQDGGKRKKTKKKKAKKKKEEVCVLKFKCF